MEALAYTEAMEKVPPPASQVNRQVCFGYDSGFRTQLVLLSNYHQ
jgi:hypothetical protein